VAKDEASAPKGGRSLSRLKVRQRDYRVEERGSDRGHEDALDIQVTCTRIFATVLGSEHVKSSFTAPLSTTNTS
jgi:hypothetical protein